MQAGLELGVAEAVRRFAAVVPVIGGAKVRRFEAESLLGAALVAEVIQAARNDPSSVFGLVKEVWSRGGAKERRTAARALGRGLGQVAPHQALGLTRDLASMSRNAREADVVGTESIAPILEAAPPLYERVLGFLQDNERWIRRAAIAGLVTYVTTKKRMAGLTLEVIMLLAEHNEKEIRSAVRWAVKEVSRVDWEGAAKAVSVWALQDKSGARYAKAKRFVAASAAGSRKSVERYVVTRLAKFANGTKPTPKRR